MSAPIMPPALEAEELLELQRAVAYFDGLPAHITLGELRKHLEGELELAAVKFSGSAQTGVLQ